MRAERIAKYVRQRPFKALEIRLENGEKHVIRRPESIIVGRTFVVIMTPKEDVVSFESTAVYSVRKLARGNGR